MKFTTSVAFAALTSLFITMGSASVVPAAFEKRADVCVPGGQTCSSIGPDCCEGFSCLVLGAEGVSNPNPPPFQGLMSSSVDLHEAQEA